MNIKKRTTIPLIGLLIYLLIRPMPLSNYVLCLGADGHVEFEVAVNGRCTDAQAFDSKHAEVMFTETTLETDHCGSCIDLAIFVSLDTQLSVFLAKNVSIHHSAPTVALVLHQTRMLSATPLFGTPLLINPTLRFLRTVTLLI